jgi:hypothetical protein
MKWPGAWTWGGWTQPGCPAAGWPQPGGGVCAGCTQVGGGGGTGWPQPGWGGAGGADGAVGGGDGAIGGGATGAGWLGRPVGGSCGSDTFPS